MDEDELRRAARVSGIRAGELPSLEQVERRRTELWLISSVLLIGMTGAFAVVSMWSPEDLSELVKLPVVRFGVLGVAVALSAYLVEKEYSLRRVSRLLMDERVLTTALSNRLHEISALLDAGRAVNSTLELDRVLDSILSGATELLPAASGTVMLLDGEELVVAAAVGKEGVIGRRSAVGDGIAGHVARTRQALLLDGRATPAMFPGLDTRGPARQSAVRSSLCVPLIEREELLGVLNLSAPAEGDFSEYDLRAVSLFAEQAATAISKARLYERSREQAQQLAHAATHDPLTGLANRAALDARALRSGAAETLLFLDLDGFKEVNDRLGHAAGDTVLRTVAERLVHCLRGDDLAARFGGDEFAVLLSGSPDALLAGQVASRIVRVLSEPIGVPGARVTVTASVGVALPEDGADHSTLLKHADRALYTAKGAGKGCWRLYQPEIVGAGPRVEQLPPEPPPAEVPAPRAEPVLVRLRADEVAS
ncbi:MAG TPA: sensor domain-containing diguanylate cyclase [Mycobacteriales bacterium]|nr:sensor domain-containing diguanylate cyclase [Mycobacteriales bacterium]